MPFRAIQDQREPSWRIPGTACREQCGTPVARPSAASISSRALADQCGGYALW